MAPPNPLKEPQLEFKALLVLVAVATLLFGLILWPFFGAVCWAVFITLVFWPLQERAVAVTRGRHGAAAFGTLVLILVIVILPLVLTGATVMQEAAAVAARIRSGELQPASYFQRLVEALPAWAQGLVQRSGLGNLAGLQHRILEALGASGQEITARAFTIGQNTLEFVVGFFVMLYLLFFLLRDGALVAQGVARAIPLREEHTERLLTQFAVVVRATVKGHAVIAIVQGLLGSLAFGVLGLPGALLWGTVMALASLLPAVGTALVWAPVALWFLLMGHPVKGIALIAWGVLVIGLVDNVLRPILVGKDAKLPDYLVLIATLGGLAVFGLNGFVIGPVIAAIFLVSWELLASARQQQV